MDCKTPNDYQTATRKLDFFPPTSSYWCLDFFNQELVDLKVLLLRYSLRLCASREDGLITFLIIVLNVAYIFPTLCQIITVSVENQKEIKKAVIIAAGTSEPVALQFLGWSLIPLPEITITL